MSNLLNATVEIHRANKQSIILRVYPDFPIQKYLPGQYGSLGLISDKDVKLIKRAYSISSSMIDLESKKIISQDDNKYLEFYINQVSLKETKREQITPKIFKLKNGDRIFSGKKITGHYTLPRSTDFENILLISSHTGESPNNSIVNHLLLTKRKINICNINVGNNWRSIYEKEHFLIENHFLNYKFIQFFDNSNNYANLTEYIDNILNNSDKGISELGFEIKKNTLIMLCGDPIMIGAPIKKGGWEYEYPDYGLVNIFTNRLFELTTRFKQGNIIYESYW